MGLSKGEMILIIICSAAASVVLGFAMFRLFFHEQEDNAFQMSDEQLAYTRSVKDRNIQGLMMEAGSGRRT